MKNSIFLYIKKVSVIFIIISVIILIPTVTLLINIPFDEALNPKSIVSIETINDEYKKGELYVNTRVDAKYTGYDYVKRGIVCGSYYYYLKDNKCTFILVQRDPLKKLPGELKSYEISGKISKIDNYDIRMMKGVAKDLDWDYNSLLKISSPVILNQMDYQPEVYLYLLVVLGLLAAMSGSVFIIHTIYFFLPALNPNMLTLYRLVGRNGTKIIETVNDELENDVVLQCGNITFTRNFIVAKQFPAIEVVPISKIIWIYEREALRKIRFQKKHRHMIYSLHIYCKNGIYIFSPKNLRKDVEMAEDYVSEHFPGIIVGYSKVNKKNAKRRIEREESGRKQNK